MGELTAYYDVRTNTLYEPATSMYKVTNYSTPKEEKPEMEWNKEETDYKKLPRYCDLVKYYGVESEAFKKTWKEIRDRDHYLRKTTGLKRGVWQRIEKAMTDCNMTISDFAEKSGVSPISITNWSNGVIPSTLNLQRASKALNVSVSYLLDGETPKSTPKKEKDPARIVDSENYYQQMRGLSGITASRKTRNIEMTKLMCRLLRQMGYEKAMDLYEQTVFEDPATDNAKGGKME